MALPEAPQISGSLDGPGIGDRMLAVEPEQLGLVVCGLRPCVDRAVVAREQLDRRRADHAEMIARRGREEMQFGVIVPPAENAVQAADLRRRLIAPAFFVQPLRSHVYAEVP